MPNVQYDRAQKVAFGATWQTVVKQQVLLVSRVHYQTPWVGHVFTDQHRSVGAVQFGHLNGLQNVVSPVQVSANPVDGETLSDSHSAVKDLSGQRNYISR